MQQSQKKLTKTGFKRGIFSIAEVKHIAMLWRLCIYFFISYINN